MNKVYLLLRNNNQTGPHSLEELVQLGLKPKDLIWIEGKSFSWSYPSEISALKPHVVPSSESAPTAPTEPTVSQAVDIPVIKPSETHQAYMPPANETSPSPVVPPVKKIYVSMPSKKTQEVPVPDPLPEQKAPVIDLEQKAEELRKRTQAYAAANKPATPATPATPDKPARAAAVPVAAATKQVSPDVVVETKYTRPVGELEEEYSSWIYNQKSKKKKKVSWGGIAAAIAVVLLLGAGFGLSKYDSSENQAIVPDEPVTQELPDKVTPGNEALIPVPSESATVLPEAVNYDKPPGTVTTEPEKKSSTSFVSNTASAPSNTSLTTVTRKEVNTATKQPVVKTPVATDKPVEKEKENTVAAVENNNKVAVKPKEVSGGANTEAPAKKKTFGDAVSGFFNKFKRKVDAVHEDDAGTTQETTTGRQPVEKPQGNVPEPGTERKAQRRGNETNPAEQTSRSAPEVKTNFEDLVDISSNEPAEKWMLGVHGLKLTIHNRSKETMRTAAVEVRYYSEQNELLEKKIVNFTNVPPSKSATLPIPDHRLADHTEYRFLSAN